jgi:Ca2+-binding EF-hand superfamily protein
MSSINSVGTGNSAMTMMQGMQRRQRPDPAEMAANLFSQLDTNGQGYLEKSDLQAAFNKVTSSTSTASASSSTDSASSVDDLFAQLDSDGDGKVTKQEFSDTLAKISEQLDNQFMNMRMQQGGMPPPPPGAGNDAGFTKEELTSQLEEIGSSDSKRSALISNIVNNFDKADSDGDGKVSMKEAMAYDQTLQSASTASVSATSSNDGATTATTSDADLSKKILQQIMQLVQAYHVGTESNTSSFSVSA